MLIKQMQYSPLQTEKDRVSEWGSFRYAVFCCMEMLLYLSSPYKYGKMYKSPCKKKAGMGDEMTFRTSDILIGGSLIIIGLTEIAHLAGCLLGWSFLTVTDLLLAEVGIVLLAAILLSVISRQTRKRATAGKNDPVADQNSGTDTAKEKSTQILTGVLIFLILLQILRILTGNRMWLTGDMTVETVNTFLRENAVYTVNPLTGTAYSMGMSLRLKILCLPTLVRGHQPFYGYGTRRRGVSSDPLHYAAVVLCSLRKPGESTFSGKFCEKTDVFADRGNTVQYRGLYARSGWI